MNLDERIKIIYIQLTKRLLIYYLLWNQGSDKDFRKNYDADKLGMKQLFFTRFLISFISSRNGTIKY